MGHVGAGWPPLSGWQALAALLGVALFVTAALVLTRKVDDRRTDDQVVEDRPTGTRQQEISAPPWQAPDPVGERRLDVTGRVPGARMPGRQHLP